MHDKTGRVVVEYGDEEWIMRPGDSLTIGRSQKCQLHLTDPEISRHACQLIVHHQLVMVFNQSTQKPLAIRPPSGEDRRVGPSSAATSLPYDTFEVVFAGRDDAPVSVQVDASGLSRPQPPVPDPREGTTRGADDLSLTERKIVNTAGRRAARQQAALLTPTQRIALIALCEPLLTRNGADARPRTTPELAHRLRWVPDYARNVIKDVRHRLSAAGVPELVSHDGAVNGGTQLRWALARWAIEWGAVTVDDLDELPPPPEQDQ
jgi:hypothetical protein